MLWFLNDPNNSNNLINFFQVFVSNNIVYSDYESNTIYSFLKTNDYSNSNLTNLNKCKLSNFKCEIKMIDNIILYQENIMKNKKAFKFKTNFIAPQNNQFKIPIFSHNYKSVSTKKLPNLIENAYEFISVLEFEIYELESQTQFIIETNPSTNSIRKYFITKNLENIKKYFDY